ncbi:homocysteine S-methyltransferase family protein [Atribacter laminatus]|uniref:Bifunctional homocysteine S-methyltransferase/5,10-methylenetetrahydrofolate reductase n=1 Tax=Atribacter laminatus TaxID=2847778 RepID=A0A7T1F371_ATRLM|nr:homocysteine S-methyltransferase family protein [Atribacter laminatus]QPM68095.1 Bifunctional homocysteine S-methyltransferase/5,10-methylenetetrahydrofolate reductase [Atribacter laminatus]
MLTDLLSKKKLVLDGAMGTRLQKAGLPAGHLPDEWNISHPDIVYDIIRSYVEAGSDIVQTNTFGSNRLILKKYGLERKIREINRQAVKIARETLGSSTLLCGSLGPVGDFIEPYGDLTKKDVQDVFKEQVDILLSEGIKIFNLETFISSAESIAATETILELGGEVISSFTFEPREDGRFTTLMGETPEKITQVFQSYPIAVLGANCGTGMKQMVKIAGVYRSHYPGYLLCKPNAGIPKVQGGQVFYSETPEDFAQGAKELLDLNINLVGGCCGTTEKHIQAIAEVVHKS